jgi:hypothetical protein
MQVSVASGFANQRGGRQASHWATTPTCAAVSGGTPFVVQMLTRAGSVLQEFPAESREAGNDVINRLRQDLASAADLESFLEGFGVPTHLIRAAVGRDGARAAETATRVDTASKPHADRACEDQIGVIGVHRCAVVGRYGRAAFEVTV